MSLYDLHVSLADADLSARLPYSYDPSQPLEPQRRRADALFRSLIGYDRMPHPTPDPAVRTEFVKDDDPRFVETRFEFESEPGFFVPAHMLMPKAPSPLSRGGKLPVMVETPSVGLVVPWVTSDGVLRSVAFVNARIDVQKPLRVRLRGVPADVKSAMWRAMHGIRVDLALERDGADAFATIPALAAWSCGWIGL